MAARYLLKLETLASSQTLSPSLKRAIDEGLSMAIDAATHHGIAKMPTTIKTLADAINVTKDRSRWAEVSDFIATVVNIATCSPKEDKGMVERRRTLAMAAEANLRMGRVADGLRLATATLKGVDEGGRLYSTVDSVAAIGLLGTLLNLGLIGEGSQLQIDGQTHTNESASALGDANESILVTEGVAVVEITRLVEEDWSAYESQVPIKVGLRKDTGGKARTISAGERFQLTITLPSGYRNGDLLHVDLPPALVWLKGGGRVKRFSADLAGDDTLEIPLLAIEDIGKAQHFAVCLRNMFEEERAGSPGLLKAGGGWLSFLS